MAIRFDVRKAIPPHKTATSEGAWDGPANEARIPNDAGASELRKAYAWIDPDKNPDTKSAYKFIHHEVSTAGTIGAANMRACSAGIAVLNGGRGGTDIPDADYEGVWRHLARHLEDAGHTPPELKSLSMPAFERRSFRGEIRAVKQPMGGNMPDMICGHAAVFNSKSEEMYGFREIVLPGAFANTIQTGDIRALFNHDPNLVLGRNKAGTLKLTEDQTGLAVEIQPPDTQAARDVLESIRRGDISQMSFGFRTLTDNWRMDGGDLVRELQDVELFDVSPVTFPAYTETDVAVRSYFEAKIQSFRSAIGIPHDPIAKNKIARLRETLIRKGLT